MTQQLCEGFLSCEVKITSFSDGSIVCNFEITVQTTMNESTLKTNIESKLCNLNITSLDPNMPLDITPVSISTQGK